MLLSVVSVLVVAQSSLEVPEGLMNNPVDIYIYTCVCVCVCVCVCTRDTHWRSWLGQCSTSRKVAGWIRDVVIGICY